MNYYKHHLGDYLRDTAHLSMLEDAAYRRLLDAYYVRERPLPANVTDCCKLARATTKPERTAVGTVLAEFFTLAIDGYHQARADSEIVTWQAQAETNRRIAANRPRSVNGSSHASHHETSNESSHDSSTKGSPPTPTPSKNSEHTPTPFCEKGAILNSKKRPAEYRENLKAAKEIWHLLLKSHGAQPERTPQIQAALDAVGGWQAITARSASESIRFERDFCRAYRGLAHLEAPA